MFAMKNAGKPYAGKPHVRIDEGESGVAIWLPTFSTLRFLKLYFKTCVFEECMVLCPQGF